MMTDLKTLAEIWEDPKTDRRPIMVIHRDAVEKSLLVGVDNDEKAYFKYGLGSSMADANEAYWKVYHEPKKLVEHWPAIQKTGKEYRMTDHVFKNIKDANDFVTNVIRLATEYPPIMLED